jgi:hypothetical protein
VAPRAPVRFVASCLLLSLLLLPGAALAQDDPAADVTDQIVLRGSVHVPRGTQAGEIVVVSGSALVEGVARGDVIVLSGPIEVRGHVSGDVIAPGGDVRVGPDAQIGGNVTARGDVHLEGGARVGGTVRARTAFTWRAPVELFGPFASWLAVSVSTLLLGLAMVLVVPRGLDAVARVARRSPLRAIGWAAAVAVGVPVVIVLSVASLVALPLGVAALLGSAPLLFAGYQLSAYAIGRRLWDEPRNPAVAFVFGWLVLRAVGAIPVAGGVTFVLAGVFGIGAACVAAWRARATAGRHRERRAAVRLDEAVREEAGL